VFISLTRCDSFWRRKHGLPCWYFSNFVYCCFVLSFTFTSKQCTQSCLRWSKNTTLHITLQHYISSEPWGMASRYRPTQLALTFWIYKISLSDVWNLIVCIDDYMMYSVNYDSFWTLKFISLFMQKTESLQFFRVSKAKQNRTISLSLQWKPSNRFSAAASLGFTARCTIA